MSSPVPSRPPTLDEVAERAQVSRTVASRVINNGPHVSRAKRDAVEKAIRDLGFTPNRAARALATRQTGVVVLAVSGDGPGVFADPFFGQIMMGASTALETTDLHLVLSLATTGHGQRRLESFLQTRGADGVMLVALRGDDPLIDIAARSGLPTVFIGLPLHGTPPFYVEADNAGGARAATEYLLRDGRRRIAMITGPDDTTVGRERRRGYTEALTLAGLRPYATEPGDFMEAGGAAAMRTLLSARPDLDAVLAANDNMAAGGVAGAARRRPHGARRRGRGGFRRSADRVAHRSEADHGSSAGAVAGPRGRPHAHRIAQRRAAGFVHPAHEGGRAGVGLTTAREC
nr:hypothetical protein GCM10020092_090320 [Actinoplanes digitatis]